MCPSDCINLYSALLYLFILLLSDDGNGFPETLQDIVRDGLDSLSPYMYISLYLLP